MGVVAEESGLEEEIGLESREGGSKRGIKTSYHQTREGRPTEEE